MKTFARRAALLGVAGAFLAVAFAGCGGTKAKHFDAIAFPAGFLWGSANAPYQCEGGNYNDDWWAWEHLPGKIANGDTAGNATDFYDLYDTDFAIAQSDGHNAFRFGIEWSRIEPQVGVWDTAEIAHYHAVITAARARGLTPVVTLEHWTLPLWADDPRNPPDPQVGWLSTAVQNEFVTFAGKMAQEYGADVDDWITFNEPMVTTVAALEGQFPPDLQGDLGRATKYALGMIAAHAKAYEAIHTSDTVDADNDGVAAKVGIAQHIVAFAPKNPNDPLDQAATTRIDHIFNRQFLDAVVNGQLDTSLTGSFVSHPELANHLDFVGLNYYRRYLIVHGLPEPILGLPEDDPNTPHNDLGWSIYPRGMYESAMEVGSYGLPVLVTENGIADGKDAKRAGYIVDHLVYLKKAMDNGVQVTGYLHWSLTDNFEWAEGYTAHFGLDSF
ncbi:MAG TPA: glycoside hydrolase family 1 protein, partial [bacterium]|nr:glycoside hydrolase family 1 protein [bacterium]